MVKEKESHQRPTILRRKQVEARTGLSRSTIYERMKKGTFPRPIRLGGQARAVGWLESEVESWIVTQIENSRKAA
jgi:prophage regulatory protein